MQITLTRGCVVNGKPHDLGAVVDVNETDARHLITNGAALEGEHVVEKPPAKPAPKPAAKAKK